MTDFDGPRIYPEADEEAPDLSHVLAELREQERLTGKPWDEILEDDPDLADAWDRAE